MRPAVQLVLGAVVVAIAFPTSSAGSIALAILGGAGGVGACLAWPHAPDWLRAPPPRVAAAVGLTIVAVLGLGTFWDVLTETPDWQMGDWGPQRTALAHLMPSLPGLHAPVWDHTVSTGDAPYDLYPSLAYFVAGHLAVVLGLEHDLPLVLMITAVLVHVAIALGTTAIAMHLASKPIAVLVGVAALVDGGAVAHGGTVGLFRWALLHSALSLAFAMIAALGVIGALTRPRLRTSIAIWMGTALACAAHPAGLIGAAASIVALAAVALLASDVPPRRALAAIGHLALGMALGAFAWMPLAARILAYGEHFPNGFHTPAGLLQDLLANATPLTWFGMLGFAGYLGVLAGLWSRRAALVYVAATALVLVVGLTELPYLALGLVPSQSVARLGVERLVQIARPFLAALGAYAIALLSRQVRGAWQGASRDRKLVGAAVLGVLCGTLFRVVPAFWENVSGRAVAEAHVFAPDAHGRAQLTRWAAERAAELGPGAWARAVFDEDTHEGMHLTAETGLPTFHMGPIPDMLLRERIEDLSPASLRRFDVRWAIGLDGRSPSIGDPDTEQALGTYRVREIRGWDGQFARIERGKGTVITTRLDSGAVEISVAADGPVLVALGTGYYPRWRATHASGADEPVYALPTIEGGALHVVAAWVAPGKTTFTCDGPLPRDHDGLVISILAALLGVAIVVAWRTRLRWRVLRQVIAIRDRLPLHLAGRVGVPVVVLLLVAKGCLDGHAPVRALRVGSGVRAGATVEARLAEGAWQDCGYESVTGRFRCEGLVTVYDSTARLLNDAEPSWAFLAPAITASRDVPGVEIRIRIAGHFAGRYLAAADGVTSFSLGAQHHDIGAQIALDLRDDGERTVELRADLAAATWQFAMVRADALDPPRPFLDGPPDTAPPEISAIR